MAIREIDGTEELKSAWRRIYASEDSFTWPFQATLTSGRIFYPTDGYYLTREQFSSLVLAAQQPENQRFAISLMEGASFDTKSEDLPSSLGTGHWLCTSPTYSEYRALPLVLENGIYSTRGGWGVLVSQEMHAIVGGNNAFVEKIGRGYSTWAEDLRELRRTWDGDSRSGWVEPLISFTEGL